MSNTTLTASDLKNLAVAFQHFETTPKIDYESFSKAMGWTKGTAMSWWCNFKKKVNAFNAGDGDGDGGDGDAPLSLGKKTKKGKGRKRKADDGEDDIERRDSASPAPKKKKAASKDAKGGKKRAASPDEDEDDDDDGLPETVIPPRPIKRQRKPKAEQNIIVADGNESEKEEAEATLKEEEEAEAVDDLMAELDAYAKKTPS